MYPGVDPLDSSYYKLVLQIGGLHHEIGDLQRQLDKSKNSFWLDIRIELIIGILSGMITYLLVEFGIYLRIIMAKKKKTKIEVVEK